MPEWTCPTCENDIDSDFDSCWNCGTTSDGVENPDFVREVDVATLPEGWVQRVRCTQCGYRGKAVIGHYGYKWWTFPVALLMSCTLVGLLPWMIVFLFLGNRKYKACPKCDAKVGLIDHDGSDESVSSEAERIWKQKQDMDDARFQKNKLLFLGITFFALLLSIAFLVITMNQN